MNTTLHRKTDNKMLAGICATIAERTNLDLNVTRLAVAGVSVVGATVGIGFAIPVLYVLGWILIPAQDQDASIAQRWFDKPQVQDAMNATAEALKKPLNKKEQ
ncbi:PspC domain-containing protein [Actinocorallia sp. A-T 12471]|uniref:PspC domain-containing protein n=1 Tax=Actinocorallia sp. A-T 12471 TaxID=3089813 RepID=UPI0029CEA08E|nr:PspC domain-containing protein [Actinocorallia sp. A-T 12471]MDX6738137.1 PspC domain-containing protein [Actinocorallia sp. A-T 12471]